MPGEQSLEGDGEEAPDSESGRFHVTRRDTLVTIATASVLSAIGPENAAAATTDPGGDINTNLRYADGLSYYEQYEDGDVDTFNIGGGTDPIMTYEYERMPDSSIYGEIAIRLEYTEPSGGTVDTGFVVFGSDSTHNTSVSDSPVEFTSEDLWTNTDPFDPADHPEYSSYTPVVDSDYTQLEPNGPPDELAREVTVHIRLRINSSAGSIDVEEVKTFDINIGYPLGFGSYFGASFGRDHVSSWPSNWNVAPPR